MNVTAAVPQCRVLLEGRRRGYINHVAKVLVTEEDNTHYLKRVKTTMTSKEVDNLQSIYLNRINTTRTSEEVDNLQAILAGESVDYRTLIAKDSGQTVKIICPEVHHVTRCGTDVPPPSSVDGRDANGSLGAAIGTYQGIAIGDHSGGSDQVGGDDIIFIRLDVIPEPPHVQSRSERARERLG